jgi:sugar/nucleoside kinase (ribokinase family)
VAILVVGSVAIDTVETPFARAESVQGGAASYFSLSGALYDPVNLVAVVGDDFPPRFRDNLQSRRVDLRGLQVVPGATFRWGGRYHLDMNTRDTLFTELGVYAGFRPDIPAAYRRSEVVFLANIQPTLQLDVLRQTEGSQLIALDTMNLWIETARDALDDVIRRVDVLLIAEEEARQIAGTTSLRAAVSAILALGPKMLVIKQGSYGALLFGADGHFFAAPAYPLEDVRDPTGAGDAFAGGFLGYLARRLSAGQALTALDYRRALVHGNILGSFACEDFSVDRLLRLTEGDITARYREFVEYTHFEGTWQDGR